MQKATCNFTALIGQGAFGPVYKAQMSTGEVVAVKMLATDSKQGEKEFHTEVMVFSKERKLIFLFYITYTCRSFWFLNKKFRKFWGHNYRVT